MSDLGGFDAAGNITLDIGIDRGNVFILWPSGTSGIAMTPDEARGVYDRIGAAIKATTGATA